MNIMKRSILRVGLFLLLPFALFYGCHTKRAFLDNPVYAEQVFAPHFQEFKVHESRRWHRLGAAAWDCTYAIIGLAETAPARPPSVEYDVMSDNHPRWFLKWGVGEWQATPVPPLRDGTRDAVAACEACWADDVAARIRSALNTPGSYRIVGSVGETVYIYSQPQRIAARIRFGD